MNPSLMPRTAIIALKALFFWRRVIWRTVILPVCVGAWLLLPAVAKSEDAAPRWWKGNLHTHSLWSDGDDYPEMIVDWYKSHHYDFLALTDHNVLSAGTRWSGANTNKGGMEAFTKYTTRFGGSWVESKQEGTNLVVRLKPLNEFRALFEDAGKFMLIQSEELTDRYKTWPVHMNAHNVQDVLKPQGGNSVLEIMQNNINVVLEQRERTKQPMFVHLNHPNFGWGVTAEEMAQVKGERFFEIYNGHPTVYNDGDEVHASTDKIWDIVLTQRLTQYDGEIMYGVGTDDSHNYHKLGPKGSNSGRGWVVVRAKYLTPESIVNAMEAGDFYASSGVKLKDVQRSANGLSIEIDGEPGVTYTTMFIGTRKGYDKANQPVKAKSGETLRVTRRYSKDLGAVLAETKGTSASYTFKGDELYVRAKIISSKPKANGVAKGEVECAWSQPVLAGK